MQDGAEPAEPRPGGVEYRRGAQSKIRGCTRTAPGLTKHRSTHHNLLKRLSHAAFVQICARPRRLTAAQVIDQTRSKRARAQQPGRDAAAPDPCEPSSGCPEPAILGRGFCRRHSVPRGPYAPVHGRKPPLVGAAGPLEGAEGQPVVSWSGKLGPGALVQVIRIGCVRRWVCHRVRVVHHLHVHGRLHRKDVPCAATARFSSS